MGTTYGHYVTADGIQGLLFPREELPHEGFSRLFKEVYEKNMIDLFKTTSRIFKKI